MHRVRGGRPGRGLCRRRRGVSRRRWPPSIPRSRSPSTRTRSGRRTPAFHRTRSSRSSRHATAISGWAPSAGSCGSTACSSPSSTRATRRACRTATSRSSSRTARGTSGSAPGAASTSSARAGSNRGRREEGLSSNRVLSIAQDRTGAIWVGTGAGLNRLEGGKLTAYGPADGLARGSIWAIQEDREGSLWIATDGGGLQSAPRREVRAVTARPTGFRRTSSRRFWSTRTAISGSGPTAAGLVRRPPEPVRSVHAERRPLERHDRDASGGSRRQPLDRHAGRRPRALFRGPFLGVHAGRGPLRRYRPRHSGGRRGQSLDRHGDRGPQPSQGRQVHVLHAQGRPFERPRPHDLRRPRRERSGWARGERGINRFEDGKFSSFTTKDGLSGDFVRSIFEDGHDRLWVGTWGDGLSMQDGGKFRVFRKKDGLPSDIVRCMYRDRAGTLWVGTDGGGLVAVRDGKFQVYGRSRGSLFGHRAGDLRRPGGDAVDRNRKRRPQPLRRRKIHGADAQGRALRRHRPRPVRRLRRLPLDRNRRRRPQPAP